MKSSRKKSELKDEIKSIRMSHEQAEQIKMKCYTERAVDKHPKIW